MLASTNINQSAPNSFKICMILRSWISLIMGLIGHQQSELFALHLELVYLTWFTPKHLHAFIVQIEKSLCLNPKGLEL